MRNNYNVYVGRRNVRSHGDTISSAGESSVSGLFLSTTKITAGANDEPTAFLSKQDTPDLEERASLFDQDTSGAELRRGRSLGRTRMRRIDESTDVMYVEAYVPDAATDKCVTLAFIPLDKKADQCHYTIKDEANQPEHM